MFKNQVSRSPPAVANFHSHFPPTISIRTPIFSSPILVLETQNLEPSRTNLSVSVIEFLNNSWDTDFPRLLTTDAVAAIIDTIYSRCVAF